MRIKKGIKETGNKFFEWKRSSWDRTGIAEKVGIKVVFWNVGGIKNKDGGFWRTIKKMGCAVFQWDMGGKERMEEGGKNIPRVYRLKMQEAMRDNNNKLTFFTQKIINEWKI